MNDTKIIIDKLTNAQNILEKANIHFKKAYEYKKEVDTYVSNNLRRFSFLIVLVVCYLLKVFISKIALAILPDMVALGIAMFLGLLMYIPPIICFLVVRSNNKKYAASKQKFIDEENAKGRKVMQDNVSALNFLPPAYVDKTAIFCIKSYLVKGQAADLNGAIDLYEEQKEQQRIRDRDNEMLNLMYAQYEQIQGLQYEVNRLKNQL